MPICDPAAARAALTDPAYAVPPLPPGDGGPTDAFRRSVARFSTGAEHARRRALAVRQLAGVDPDRLRAAARERAAAGPGGPAAAERVVVAVLAEALGAAYPDALAELVPAVAAAYHPGTGAAADAAVVTACALLGPGTPEQVAARLGLLVQACAATAALATAGLAEPRLATAAAATTALATAGLAEPRLATAAAATTAPDRPGTAEEAVAAALAAAPPVPATRRAGPDGTVPRVELGGGLAFGAGPHRCPGEPHALAIAAGIVAAARDGS